jgi:hypothetical protein
MPSTLCSRCFERCVQHRGNLCRRCARATGLVTSSIEELDRRRIERRMAEQAKLDALKIQPAPPTGPKVVTIDGEDFEIVYDGTRR